MAFWFHKPDHYSEYVSLESKLNALIARGEDESAQGDSLREAMVKLWWKLTDDQKRELSKHVDLPKVPELTNSN